jgi:membrane protease YdiL (CAAX protease family)
LLNFDELFINKTLEITMINAQSNSIISTLINSNGIIKITLFLIIWGVIWLPIAFPLSRLIKWHPRAPISNSQKLTLITSLYLIAPFLAWGVMGQRSLNQILLIFKASLLHSILLGYVVGIITIVLIDGIEWGLGWLQWQKPPQLVNSALKTLPLLFLVSLLVASVEELIFRGVFVQFLSQDFNVWLTAVISSLVFALLHLLWERKDTLAQLPGLFLMGMVLFYSVTIEGNIALAIGIHGGWVLAISSLDTLDIYQYNSQVNPWLCGTKGKPLASLAGLMVLIVTAFILFFVSSQMV